MEKGKKQLVHRIVFGVLAALFLVFNVAIYVAFDYLTKATNNMGLKLDSVEAESVRAEATEFTKEITREGMVLLRNKDNALPLPAGSAINLFGWSSTQDDHRRQRRRVLRFGKHQILAGGCGILRQ